MKRRIRPKRSRQASTHVRPPLGVTRSRNPGCPASATSTRLPDAAASLVALVALVIAVSVRRTDIGFPLGLHRGCSFARTLRNGVGYSEIVFRPTDLHYASHMLAFYPPKSIPTRPAASPCGGEVWLAVRIPNPGAVGSNPAGDTTPEQNWAPSRQDQIGLRQKPRVRSRQLVR